MIFAFLFGLSMDYEVFIVTRIREAYDETGDTAKAVELGLARTGKLVTSAALVLVFAFFSLSTGPGPTSSSSGSVSLPGVLRRHADPGAARPVGDDAAGRANWWFPAPLRKLLFVERANRCRTSTSPP